MAAVSMRDILAHLGRSGSAGEEAPDGVVSERHGLVLGQARAPLVQLALFVPSEVFTEDRERPPVALRALGGDLDLPQVRVRLRAEPSARRRRLRRTSETLRSTSPRCIARDTQRGPAPQGRLGWSAGAREFDRVLHLEMKRRPAPRSDSPGTLASSRSATSASLAVDRPRERQLGGCRGPARAPLPVHRRCARSTWARRQRLHERRVALGVTSYAPARRRRAPRAAPARTDGSSRTACSASPCGESVAATTSDRATSPRRSSNTSSASTPGSCRHRFRWSRA